MKTLVTARPISNGGDYLIVDSGLKLFDRFLGEKNYRYVNGCGKDWKELNLEEFDNLIVFGGPLFSDELLKPSAFPLIYQMMELNKKVYFLAAGWYGADDGNELVYDYHFSNDVLEMLSYVNENGILGCRDYLTCRVLGNHKLTNIMMTGCTVWYSHAISEFNPVHNIRKIAISDIGTTKNPSYHEQKYLQLVSVLELIREMYPDAELIFTFNNGIHTKYSSDFNLKVVKYLEKQKISYEDLSYNADAFSVYDDCDLHVGYRVHSHIYALTHNIPSVLICEDARGCGLNRTLGLEVIKANSNPCGYENNPYLRLQLENILREQDATGFMQYSMIKKNIEYFYQNVICKFFELVSQ